MFEENEYLRKENVFKEKECLRRKRVYGGIQCSRKGCLRRKGV